MLQIKQPSLFRCTQLQYRFAVISEAPSRPLIPLVPTDGYIAPPPQLMGPIIHGRESGLSSEKQQTIFLAVSRIFKNLRFADFLLCQNLLVMF